MRRERSLRPAREGWRHTLYEIIFEADTPAGRWFDIGLLIAIVISIAIVSLETVPFAAEGTEPTWLGMPLETLFERAEWVLTILFTIEYALRTICVRRPLRYVFSFWGAIDLLSILPMYLALFIAQAPHTLLTLRSIRLLRVFRVLKLWRMMSGAEELADAVWRSREKVIVFLAVVLVAVTISATLMYHVETVWRGEGPESEFTSIPQAMYWAIVTMTTVGYGDVVPQTTAGKVISAALILLGYSLIIVPTGFVSAELSSALTSRAEVERHPCPGCGASQHRTDADYCYRCGSHLDAPMTSADAPA